MLSLLAQTYEYDYYGTVDVSGDAAAATGLIGSIVAVQFIIWIILYVYAALCLQFIAKKTNTPNGWMAWIPIANLILILQIAQLPLWYIVLMFIPLVNIVIIFIVWIKILEACGRPGWWVILLILPIVNFIIMGVVAFSKDGSKASASPASSPPAPTPPASGTPSTTPPATPPATPPKTPPATPPATPPPASQ